MALLALPGEVRSIGRSTTLEHGWPAVWLDRQKRTAATQESFDDWCDSKSEFRLAEIETGFSPQFARPPASAFWSRMETWPRFKADETFTKVRWTGAVFDLAIWIFGLAFIFILFRYLKSQNIGPWQLPLRWSLFLFSIASLTGVFYAYFDRVRDREQAVVDSLQTEKLITFDFTSDAPVWLERITDYRFRTTWIRNLFRRGVRNEEVAEFGLFDRVLSIRLKGWTNGPSGGDMVPSVLKPGNASKALNELSQLEQIWVDCRDDASINELLSQVDGKQIVFMHIGNQFKFDPKKTSILHFSDLESLCIENATHIPEGLVGSFPKLRNLTLKSYYREELTIGESVIEEILALRDLKQLALSRYALDEHQLKRLQDELKRKSIRLYLN